jgi:hypothetical protein
LPSAIGFCLFLNFKECDLMQSTQFAGPVGLFDL